MFDQLFNESIEDLKKSNNLWKESLDYKRKSQDSQAMAAEIIKNIYDKFHDVIIKRTGLQGKVSSIISEEDSSITGLELELPKTTGGTENIKLLIKDFKYDENNKIDKHSSSSLDETTKNS